jgi:2'-5' RNA ligase
MNKFIKLVESNIKDSKVTLVENSGNHKYSSTQIEAPKEIAEGVLRFSLNIPDEEIYDDITDPSFGRELDIHITVKYGLETINYEDINKILNGLKEPLEIKLGKISCFYGKDIEKFYDVVKVEVESNSLVEMHELLNKLPNKDEHPEYKPHMTIAYVKEGFGKKYEGNKTFEGLVFKFDTLRFNSKDKSSKDIPL